jgi:hypothetical protein
MFLKASAAQADLGGGERAETVFAQATGGCVLLTRRCQADQPWRE